MDVNSHIKLELVRVEAAEEELDRFIERRSREKSKANAVEEAWQASERRYYRRQHEENRQEWAAYHLAQADILEATARELADSHRARAQALLEAGGGGLSS